MVYVREYVVGDRESMQVQSRGVSMQVQSRGVDASSFKGSRCKFSQGESMQVHSMGGTEWLKGCSRDITIAFMRVHRWWIMVKLEGYSYYRNTC